MTHKNLDLIVSIQSLGLVQQVSGNKNIRCIIRRYSILVSIPRFLVMLTQSTILFVQSNFLVFCYSYMVIWYPKTIMGLSLKDNTSFSPPMCYPRVCKYIWERACSIAHTQSDRGPNIKCHHNAACRVCVNWVLQMFE